MLTTSFDAGGMKVDSIDRAGRTRILPAARINKNPGELSRSAGLAS
jgi:hypothetical protein